MYVNIIIYSNKLLLLFIWSTLKRKRKKMTRFFYLYYFQWGSMGSMDCLHADSSKEKQLTHPFSTGCGQSF